MRKRIFGVIFLMVFCFSFSNLVFAEGSTYVYKDVINVHDDENIKKFIASDPQMKDAAYSAGDGSVTANWMSSDDNGNFTVKNNFTCSWQTPSKTLKAGEKITLSFNASSAGSSNTDARGSGTISVLTSSSGEGDSWDREDYIYGEFNTNGGTASKELTVPNAKFVRITYEFTLGGKIRLGKHYNYQLAEENTTIPSETEFENDNITVTLLRGTAQFKHADNDQIIELKAGVKYNISVNDEITTGSNSRVLMEYPDGSVFKIKPDTNVTLKTGGFVLNVGEAWFSLQKQGKAFQCVTPDSVCGVLGTEFSVLVKKDGTTTISLAEGSVDVRSTKSNKNIILKPGQSITADNKDLKKVKSIDATALINNWEKEFSNNAVNNSNKLFIILITVLIVVLLVAVGIFIKRRNK